MRAEAKLILAVIACTLTACNKSSPPPQKPVTPRGVAIELPVQLLTP